MTKEEILEGNKLIAEFMEVKKSMGINGDLYCLRHLGYWEPLMRDYRCDFKEYFELSELKYHTSWDWLMPCIGKISNKCEEPEELDGLKYALLTNNIEEAWIFCVEFIKWYNEKLSE